MRGGAPRVGIRNGSRGFTVTARGRRRTTPGSLVTETPTDGTGAVTIDATVVIAAEDPKGEGEEWEQWPAAAKEGPGGPMKVGALPWCTMGMVAGAATVFTTGTASGGCSRLDDTALGVVAAAVVVDTRITFWEHAATVVFCTDARETLTGAEAEATGRLITLVVTQGAPVAVAIGTDVGTTSFVTTGPLVVTLGEGGGGGRGGGGAGAAGAAPAAAAVAATAGGGDVVAGTVGETLDMAAQPAAAGGGDDRESKLRDRLRFRRVLSSSICFSGTSVDGGSVFTTTPPGSLDARQPAATGVRVMPVGATSIAPCCKVRGGIAMGPLSPEHDGAVRQGPLPVA